MPDEVKPEDLTPRRPERAEPRSVGSSGRSAQPPRGSGNRGKILAVLGVLVALAVGVWLLGPRLFGGPELLKDYTGAGKDDIIIEVRPGDSGAVIAQGLVDKGVIGDVNMFIGAASGNAELAAIQPGYYKVRTQIPAATAVQARHP
jgi:UPF0755 protein